MKITNINFDHERRSCISWVLFSLPFLSAVRFNRGTPAATSLDARQLLKSGLEDIVRDRPVAGQIGSAYLAAHPHENDLDRLAGDFGNSSLEGDSDILKQRISALRVRDFANEDITIIDGWVLARVEARVCALMHIL
jgi:hypothetical protein